MPGMTPLALTLTLALAAAGDPVASTEPVPAGGDATVQPSADAGSIGLRGWREGLAPGLHSTTFWSQSHHQYTFHSFSVGVLASWGQRGPFVHASWLLPLQGREDGNVYAIGRYYRMHYGGDFLAGWQWRWQQGPLEAEAGGGPHATFLALKGVEGYRDFSASPLGLGGQGTLRWRTGRGLGRWPVTLAVYGSAAMDFYDPFHGNDLRHGFTFRAGLLVGLEPRGRR